MGQEGHFYAETHGDGLHLASDQGIKGFGEVGLRQFDLVRRISVKNYQEIDFLNIVTSADIRWFGDHCHFLELMLI